MSVIAFGSEDQTQTHYARLPKDFFDNAPPPKTISPKKLAANRANAAKSTGPRTPEGKQRSSQNATTHALTTSTIGNYKQDPTYHTIRHELYKELRPTSPTQLFLVDELALIVFKLDLLFPQVEHQIMNTPLGSTEPVTPPAPSPDQSAPDPRLAAPVIATHLLANGPTPLTRLWDYRRRLMSRYQSILRQLPKLKQQANQIQARDHQRQEDKEWDRKAREEWLAIYGPEAQARHRAQAEAAIAAAQTAATSPTQPQTPPAQNEPTNPEVSNSEISNSEIPNSEIPNPLIPNPPSVSSVSSVSSVPPLPTETKLLTPPAQNEPTTNPEISNPEIPNRQIPGSPSVSSVPPTSSTTNQPPAPSTPPHAHEKTTDTMKCRPGGCSVKLRESSRPGFPSTPQCPSRYTPHPGERDA